MRNLIEMAKALLERSELFEMATVSPRITGLPYGVFVSQKGGARNSARVKISSTGKSANLDIVVRVDPMKILHGKMSSSDYEKLTRWIELNRQTILDYWNEEIQYTDELMDRLVPIE